MPYEARYIGDSLRALVNDGVREATNRLRDDIARQARSTLFDAAREATPERSGRTRNAWLAMELRHDGDVTEARVINDDPTAIWLNYGTAEHEIEPKERRAVETPVGPRAHTRVRGIQPHHMAEKAVEAAARTINETTYADREHWKREVEQAIEAAKRKTTR